MATVIPPPSKRQKIDATNKALALEEAARIPTDLGNIRIQFVDQSTSLPVGSTISLPVKDSTIKNLETLLNTLQNHDSSTTLPYRFFFRPKDTPDSDIIDISSNLWASILQPQLRTTEDTITLHFTPQAIFRVRAVSRCSASISGHSEAILTTSFSPATSSRVATGSGDNTARIWDTDTGTPLHTLKGHTSWVLVVSWSPDGAILATGSMDNTLRLWDPITGNALGGPLKAHSKWVTSLSWEPYHTAQPGRPRLASASKDSTVRIWDVPLRRVEHTLTGHKSSVTCVRWGGIHRLYTSSQDKTIKIYNTRSWNCLFTLGSHVHWVNHLALSTDFVLRTAYHEPKALRDKNNQSPPQTIEEKKALAQKRFNTSAMQSGRITERLISASDDNTMFLWDPSDPAIFNPDSSSSTDKQSSSSPKPLARLLGHQSPILHVTPSPSGTLLASCSLDKSIKLWSALTGSFILTLRGHVGAVYMVCFSPDSRLLASASKDTTVKVWDVATGKLKEDLPGHQDEVFALEWSADGLGVVSGGKDKNVRIWKS